MKKGFTLMEILIVISIIILLAIIVFMNLKGQSDKAYDVKRKADLYKLHKAFEEYTNDHDGLPPVSVVETCGGTGLSSYLATVPCDPQTQKPYGYFIARNGGYRLCTKLSFTGDPAIAAMGCTGVRGCGVGSGYNYCLARGVPPSAVGTSDQIFSTPTPTPTPTTPTATPTPISGEAYACTPPDEEGLSRCDRYSNPAGFGCPRTFTDPLCDGLCNAGDGAYWCEH